jgi:hypothetical protein
LSKRGDVSDQGYDIFDGVVITYGDTQHQASLRLQLMVNSKMSQLISMNGHGATKVRTTTPEYAGFRVALAASAISAAYSCSGEAGIPFSGGCYKAKFSMKELGDTDDF